MIQRRSPASSVTSFWLLAALTSNGLLAQSYVVDQANGPGTDFTSLGEAIRSVPTGASLMVRAGSYVVPSDLPITRGISILGQGGVSVSLPAGVGPTPPTESVRIANVTLSSENWIPSVVFSGIRGPLILDSVRGSSQTVVLAFDFAGCEDVHLQDVVLDGFAWPTGGRDGYRFRFGNSSASLYRCSGQGDLLLGGGGTEGHGEPTSLGRVLAQGR